MERNTAPADTKRGNHKGNPKTINKAFVQLFLFFIREEIKTGNGVSYKIRWEMVSTDSNLPTAWASVSPSSILSSTISE